MSNRCAFCDREPLHHDLGLPLCRDCYIDSLITLIDEHEHTVEDLRERLANVRDMDAAA